MDMTETEETDQNIFTLDNGHRAKRLRNGAIYDYEVGRIVDASECTTKITSENSREIREARYVKARDAAAEGMSSINDVSTSKAAELDAWRLICANLAHTASTKQDRTAVEAAKFLGRAADLLPDRTSKDVQSGQAVHFEMTNEAVSVLSRLLDRMETDG